jgi:hypothetical protein
VRWAVRVGVVSTAVFARMSVGRLLVQKRPAVGFAVAWAIALGAPVAAQADDPPAPDVTTLAVTDVTTTTARFHAKVNPNATVTTGYFVYGTAPDQLTLSTPDVAFDAGPGERSLDAVVGHLSVNTKYYVLAVAENEDWIVPGGLVSFSTLTPPEILGSSMSDVTYKSATLHLNVATHGQPVTVTGSIKSDLRFGIGPGGVRGRSGGVVTPFGPIAVAADGDVAIPLPALDAASGYAWTAKATSVAGDASSSGAFRTESLISMPKPTLTPAFATYGSHVKIAGTIPGKPGLVLTLAEQAFPYSGPIVPLAGMTVTTDATGAYSFDVRAEHAADYGVTADGAAALAAVNLAALDVAPAVTAKVTRARHHRFVVAGRYQPAIATKVSLYRRGVGRVGSGRRSKGTFRFPARVLKPGKYEVRVVPAVDTGFENTKSAAVTVPRR